MHDRDTWKQVARLHAENLDQGFLATLGPRFLTLMYQAIDECENAVLLVETRDDGVIGFVTGAGRMGPIYRRMLRHWPRLFLALLPSLLNPRRFWRILEILFYTREAGHDETVPAYELLSIAVDPSVRGQGVSESLYRRLISRCRESDIPAFKIVVGENLVPAHRFYQRMGARVVGETEVHGGERSLVYVQEV